MQVQPTSHSSSFEGRDFTKDESMNMDALLSALVDGELSDGECDQLMQHLALSSSPLQGQRSFQAWEHYHVVGECLRTPGQSHAAADSMQFLHTFRERLAADESIAQQAVSERSGLAPAPTLAPVRVTGNGEAANASVFRWKMVAGFASLAAVAAIGWNSVTGLSVNPGQPMQLASGSESPVVVASDDNVGSPLALSPNAVAVANRAAAPTFNQDAQQNGLGIVIRDPKLDEVLSRQYGNTVALQPPAPFLRNASANGGIAH